MKHDITDAGSSPFATFEKRFRPVSAAIVLLRDPPVAVRQDSTQRDRLRIYMQPLLNSVLAGEDQIVAGTIATAIQIGE